MAHDLTVLVADPPRIASFRDELRLAGRVLRFSSSNLPTVLESIRANQPGTVAIDAQFIATAAGQAFVDRVGQMAIPALEICIVARHDGAWTTRPLVDPTSTPAAGVDAKSSGLNTRRAKRFPVVDPLHGTVNTSEASLIDLSVLGAQVLSEPVLRPNQKIKLALPDAAQTLQVMATIKWSWFEKPTQAGEAYYRAGVEFIETKPALEDYCRRHCTEDPLPNRQH